MRERHAGVWHEDQRVGVLRADERGVLHFRYDADWSETGFPVSLRLPFSLGTQETNAHGFFQGLLPEGRSRLRLCRRLKIDPEDDAGLLFAIGEDCAGALSVLPEGREPEAETGSPERIGPRRWHDIVLSQGGAASPGARESRRFSLAGAQDKMAVIMTGDGYAEPTRRWPSSHILKFETVRHVCFAEHVTLELARAVGLEVVACEFHRLDGEDAIPYLLVERYDRYLDEQGIRRRLHQEDLVQALGYTTDLKYEQDAGPGLADVVRLLRDHTPDPVPATRRIVDWQIFNYLTGNSDGHGKNLALLYRRGRALPELAPFYDLIAIDFLNRAGPTDWDRRMAFSVGGECVPERIGRRQWERFAEEIRFRPRYVLARLADLAERIDAAVGPVRNAFADRFGDSPVNDQLERSITERCRWTLRMLGRGAGGSTEGIGLE